MAKASKKKAVTQLGNKPVKKSRVKPAGKKSFKVVDSVVIVEPVQAWERGESIQCES